MRSPPLGCSWVNASWVGRAAAQIPELSSLWQRVWNREGRHDDRFVPCAPKECSVNHIPESPWTPRWSRTVVASSGHCCFVCLRAKLLRAPGPATWLPCLLTPACPHSSTSRCRSFSYQAWYRKQPCRASGTFHPRNKKRKAREIPYKQLELKSSMLFIKKINITLFEAFINSSFPCVNFFFTFMIILFWPY